MASENPQKNIVKKYEKLKLSDFFSEFGCLNYHPSHILRPLFHSQFFLSSNFYFGHKTPRGLKTWEN